MHRLRLEWVNKNIKWGSHNHLIQSPNEMRLQVFIDIKGCRSRHFSLRFTIGPNSRIIKYSVVNKVHLCINWKISNTPRKEIHMDITHDLRSDLLQLPGLALYVIVPMHAKRNETRAWSKVTWKRRASYVTIYFSLLKEAQDNPFFALIG